MKKTKKKIYPFLQQFFYQNHINLAFSIIGAVLSSCGSLMISLIFQNIVDSITGNGKYTLNELFFATIIAFAGIFLSIFISSFFNSRFISKGIKQYRNYVFNKVIYKNINSFSEDNSSIYMSLLTNDVIAIQRNYLENITQFVELILTLVGALILMFMSNPLLTVISLFVSFIPILISLIIGNKLEPLEVKLSNYNGLYTNLLKDIFSGFEAIKSFKAENNILRIYEKNNKALTSIIYERTRISFIIESFSHVVGNMSQVFVFFICAAYAFHSKRITAGTVILFMQLMNYVINPISYIPQLLASRKAAFGLIEKVVMKMNSDTCFDGEINLKELKQGIEIQNLSFSYEDTKTVLENINLSFELGKSYIIVGNSGCGKTTLLNLLMKVYTNYNGNIEFDSLDIRNISLNSLYDMISIIHQNIFIFDNTILQNITMFGDFSQEQIDNAIVLSGLTELIHEKGLSFMCGECGCNLSGGEKQRISIARSILKQSSVILADEATSALDPITSNYIYNSILNLTNITKIIVTHSLDEQLLRQVDCIIVMKNGEVVENGSFCDLMSRKKFFYSLFTISQ